MLIASEVSVSFDPGENYVKVGVVKKVPNIVVPKSEAISIYAKGLALNCCIWWSVEQTDRLSMAKIIGWQKLLMCGR